MKTLANPGPLGLFAFALTTALLCAHNAGLIPLSIAIIAMALVFGGGAQFVAGVLEFFKGNTFGMTAFCGYGAFWVALGLILTSPAGVTPFLIAWTLFTAALTLRLALREKPFDLLMVVFLALLTTFVTLSLGFHVIGGYYGLVTAGLAGAEAWRQTK